MEGYIYLMENENGTVKIGYSVNPGERCHDINDASGNTIVIGSDIDVLTTIETDNMERVEERLHRLFSEYNIEGEWFDLPDNDVEWLCEVDRINEDDQSIVYDSSPSMMEKVVGFLCSFTVTDDGLGFTGYNH